MNMNMQPPVLWDVNWCGLILRFTQQVRSNHWHPIKHLLNYTASFPIRSKSHSSALYKHLKSQSQGYLTESFYIQTQNHIAMLTLAIWTALITVISDISLRLTDLYQWQHLVIYERQQSAYRQWQIDLHVLKLQNFHFTTEILENNFNILRQHIFVFFILSDSSASEFYVPTFRNTACSVFRGGVRMKNVLPAYTTYEDGTVFRKVSTKFRRLGNHPKKEYNIQNTAKV